jgi:hypothetical protein
MVASSQNLTAEELDELRKIGAATDAQRDPPVLAAEIAGKLRAFGTPKTAEPGH